MRAAPCWRARLAQRGCGLLGVGDVATHGMAADLARHRARAVEIDVHADDLRPGAGKRARGRSAEAGSAAGHQRGMSLDVHDQFFRVELALAAAGFSSNSAMPWPPPMQAAAMP